MKRLFSRSIILIAVAALFQCSQGPEPALSEARLLPSPVQGLAPARLSASEDSLKIRIRDLQTADAVASPDYSATLRNLALILDAENKVTLAGHFFRRSCENSQQYKCSNDYRVQLLDDYLNFIRRRNLRPEIRYVKLFVAQSSRLPSRYSDNLNYSLDVLINHYRDNKLPEYYLYYIKWKTALAGPSRSPELLYDLALAYYDNDKLELSDRTLEQLQNKPDLTPDLQIRILLLSAKIARKQKGILKSTALYKKARTLCEKNPYYLDICDFGLAEDFFVLRNYKEAEFYALSALQASADLYGKNSRATRNRILLLRKIYDFSGQYHKLNETNKLMVR